MTWTNLMWKTTRSVYIHSLSVFIFMTHLKFSDDPVRGPVHELDLGSDSDEPPPLPTKSKRSKQLQKPAKIIPTGSDLASDEYSSDEGDDDDDDDDDDEPVTMANMEARSRALDAEALAEAERDVEEQQAAAKAGDGDIDMEGDEDGDSETGGAVFHLPTQQEREEEKRAGGPDVQVVQRRMHECVRVLGDFKKLARKGRCVVHLKNCYSSL